MRDAQEYQDQIYQHLQNTPAGDERQKFMAEMVNAVRLVHMHQDNLDVAKTAYKDAIALAAAAAAAEAAAGDAAAGDAAAFEASAEAAVRGIDAAFERNAAAARAKEAKAKAACDAAKAALDAFLCAKPPQVPYGEYETVHRDSVATRNRWVFRVALMVMMAEYAEGNREFRMMLELAGWSRPKDGFVAYYDGPDKKFIARIRCKMMAWFHMFMVAGYMRNLVGDNDLVEGSLKQMAYEARLASYTKTLDYFAYNHSRVEQTDESDVMYDEEYIQSEIVEVMHKLCEDAMLRFTDSELPEEERMYVPYVATRGLERSNPREYYNAQRKELIEHWARDWFLPVWDGRYRYKKKGDGGDTAAENGDGYWFVNDFRQRVVCAY